MGIGILGGTFNPIHLGHLRAAEEVRERFNLEKIYFVPCNIPPHKEFSPILETSARLEMVRLAIRGVPYFKLSDIEIKRGGKSYSIDTVNYFLKKGIKKNELYFIIGSDAFADITKWKDYEQLLNSCNIIILKRPGFKSDSVIPLDLLRILQYNKKTKCYETFSKTRIFLTDIKGLEISSSMIRDLLRVGKSIRFLVPDRVVRYIEKKFLEREK